MARKVSKDLNPEKKQQEIREKLKTTAKQPLKIEFISPYFGGGIEAGSNDEKKLVRETSIRGQLRFWWRATVGAKYPIDKMRDREAAIFGSTLGSPGKSSRVIIKVGDGNISNGIPYDYNSDISNNKFFKNGKSYVLFPFRETNYKGKSPKNLYFNLKISIKDKKEDDELSVPEIEKDLKDTLTAWINFGGLGSRTRRGLGSLYCKDYAFANIEEIKQFLQKIKSQKQNTSFPSINKIFYKDNVNDWAETAKSLQEYRKEKIKNRDDLINDNCFRSAEFGLPVIMEIKKIDKNNPPKLQVVPVVQDNEIKERFASPLIMKTIKLKDGKMYQILILLNGKDFLKGVKLQVLSAKGNQKDEIKALLGTDYLDKEYGIYLQGDKNNSVIGDFIKQKKFKDIMEVQNNG